VTLPLDRRRNLQELGLRALVKRRFGAEVADSATPRPLGGGAALVAGTRLAAVFADGSSGLGAAIDLAGRENVEHLYFFSERNDGAVARRAAEFRVPTTVVDPDGDFEDLAAGPVPPAPTMPASLEAAATRFGAAGLDVEWEHGAVTGEWLGLEVARAVLDGDRVVVDVGVGHLDREANRMVYPDGAPDAFLDQAVAAVRERRRPSAPAHPARDLVPERWLRSVLRRRPGLAGLEDLRTGPSPEERKDLTQRSIAAGWGGRSGIVAVVACTVGVDPDAVPQAADARLQAGGWPGFAGPANAPSADSSAADLLIVVPAGDDHPLTRRLAALLRYPAEVVTVPAGWREAAS
jgi:hypothetical protein